ncbi:hypothetical protein ABPG77_000695 [Micractinium sp. CCAP 211/92]
MVIMGSSGAGKTTLLDVLACNLFGGGTVSGEVLVNGAPRRPREFSQISCYVMQRDVLLASSTVREALLIAALLKLPRSMPTAAKVAQVDAVLADLELEGCQHTLIGDEVLGMKGISGGQRRRVSVGVELVKKPRVLFMDEPTSGLDSEMAVSLVDTLVRLARQNRTVCTTIHQPNSYITSKFDDFMLLHAGSVAYFGPWSESVSYFASQGCPCPQYTNPTDFYMATLKERGDALVAAWAKQEGAGQMGLAALEAGEAAAGKGADGERGVEEPAQELGVAPRVSWPYQVYVLGGRMLRMWWRNPVMLVSESAQYGFMAIFVGLVYLQVSDSVATGINDRAASMWLAMAILSFTPSYTSVVIWDKDRLLLRRETQQGMYNVTAWFAAKTATTWPVEIAQTTLFCVVMYWMVGYAPSAAAFFIFVAVFCMFQLTSETIGTMCAIACGNATYAILLLTFVLLFLLSFSGFLVSAVPVYFRWISKISYLTYAYAAVIQNEFTRINLTTEGGETVSGTAVYDGSYGGSPLGPINNGLSIAANVGVLLGITLGARALAFALLFALHRLKRL